LVIAAMALAGCVRYEVTSLSETIVTEAANGDSSNGSTNGAENAGSTTGILEASTTSREGPIGTTIGDNPIDVTTIETLEAMMGTLGVEDGGAVVVVETSTGIAEGNPTTGEEETTSEGGTTTGCTTDLEGLVCIAAGSFVDPFGVTQEIGVFLLDRTEVTVSQYEACVQDGGCTAVLPGYRNADNSSFNYGSANRREHPINGVTWDEANAYCVWAGGRLATTAELEWAARGREAGRTYPWGDTPEPNCSLVAMEDARGNGCGLNTTSPVGSRSPDGDSLDGVQDIGGNVWEWTSNLLEGSSNTRIFRGGSFENPTTYSFRADYFAYNTATTRGAGLGVRCARTGPSTDSP